MRLLLADDSAIGCQDKLQELGALGAGGNLAFDFAHRLAGVESALVEQAVGLVYLFDAGVAESASAKANGIHALVTQGFARDDDEGGHIFANEGAATDHRVGADFDKLVHCRESAQNRPIANFYVASERNVVDQNYVVANDAVVGNVGIGHDEAFFAQDGFAECFGAAVNGGSFADYAAIAQKNLAVFSAEFQVLGHSAYHSVLVDAAVFAQPGAGKHVAAAHDPGSVAQHAVLFDHCEGIDSDVSGQFGVGMH